MQKYLITLTETVYYTKEVQATSQAEAEKTAINDFNTWEPRKGIRADLIATSEPFITCTEGHEYAQFSGIDPCNIPF